MPGELESADQKQILVFSYGRATPCLVHVDGGAGGGLQYSFASSEWKDL